MGIIRNGIPNTPMPATNVSEVQAVKIVAYLRSVAESRRSVAVAGDAARGRTIFESKGDPARPAIASTAAVLVSGLTLSRVGQLRRAIELEQSLLEPGGRSPAGESVLPCDDA